MGMLHLIEASHASKIYVKYGSLRYSALFDSCYSLSLPFTTFSSTFTLFNFYPRRENYVFNGYLCRVMCTELIDIRLRRYVRLYLPCLLNIDRWQDRVTPKEKALLLVCCEKYTLDETYRSWSIPMARMYYSVVREYKLCHIFGEVYGNQAGGVCCFRKKCIIIFFNYFMNLPSRWGTFMFTYGERDIIYNNIFSFYLFRCFIRLYLFTILHAKHYYNKTLPQKQDKRQAVEGDAVPVLSERDGPYVKIACCLNI